MNPSMRPFAQSGRSGGRGFGADRVDGDMVQLGHRGAFGLGTQSGAFRAVGARTALKGGSEMMSAGDLRHVCDRVLQSLRFPDPYTDDYYYIQVSVKRNSTAREAAIKEERALPEPIRIPQPVWRDVKERIRGQIDDFKQKIWERSREWETKERVLGHNVRSQPDRPKAQLHVPSLRELRSEEVKALGGMDGMDGAGGDDSSGEPFSSRLWTMRAAVLRGYEALSTVQELTHLLRSGTAAQDPYARSEILYDMDRALNLLSQSVGIRLPTTGTLTTSQGGAMQGPEPDVQLEGGLVATLMQSAKGRKLLSRSMNLLPPNQRWALIPVILARVLQSDPAEQNDEVRPCSSPLPLPPSLLPDYGHTHSLFASPAAHAQQDKEVEETLMKTILLFVQHSRQFQVEQQNQTPPNVTHPFTLILLTNLRQTVRSCMVAHLEKSKLRSALLSSRHRAEVMHVLVMLGEEIKLSVDDVARNEWMHICEAFYLMLDSE